MNKIQKRVFTKNLDTFKLLITDKRFEEEMVNFRKQRETAQAKLIAKGVGDPQYGMSLHPLYHDQAVKIIKKYNLPFHFKALLVRYLQIEKIKEEYIPYTNYFFKYLPVPTINSRHGRAIEPVHEVHLVTFTQLTGEELRQASRDLKKEQKHMFPQTANFTRTKALKDVDLLLGYEKRGYNRKRAQMVEEYTGIYLPLMKKKYERGEISKKKFDELKKVHVGTIEKKKIRGYFAKDIAKETKSNLSSSGIRHAIKRIEKARRDRFDTRTESA